MMGFPGYGWGMFGFGWLLTIIWWIVIVFIILRVIRLFAGEGYHQGQNSAHGSSKTALDILRERYAKGEISKKEFEEIKKDLV